MIWNDGMIWWFLITLIFIGIELSVPALVSIWFAFSALIVTMISGVIKDPINEFYVFVVLSGVFLVLTRPIVKKLLSKRKPIEDRIVSQEVKIIKKIDDSLYEVKLDGKYWRATCDEKLEVGDLGIVKKLEGNKLVLIKV